MRANSEQQANQPTNQPTIQPQKDTNTATILKGFTTLKYSVIPPEQFVIPGHVSLPDDDVVVAPDYYVVYNGSVISIRDIYSHKEVVVDGKAITRNNYKSITYPLIVASTKCQYDQDIISISSYHDLQLVVKAFDNIIEVYKNDYILVASKLWQALKGIKISSFDALMLIEIFEYLDKIMKGYTDSQQDMMKRYYLIMIKLYYIKVAYDDLGGLVAYAAEVDIAEQLMPGIYDEIMNLIEDKHKVIPKAASNADNIISNLWQQDEAVRNNLRTYARRIKEYSELYEEMVKDIRATKYDYSLLNDANILELIDTIIRYYYIEHTLAENDELLQDYLLIANNLDCIIDSYLRGYDFTVLDNIGDLSDYSQQIVEELEANETEEEAEEDELVIHLKALAYDTYKEYKRLLENGYEVRDIDKKLGITDSWEIIEAYEDRIIAELNDQAMENLRTTYYSVVLGRVFTIYKLTP